ncbi:MAG TPA: hypothetical protein VHA52_10165, partial [Candidatus Babeliaceae bacterium]|nr:hypothetical protein [Candidatus Babeliaceae bacterium]
RRNQHRRAYHLEIKNLIDSYYIRQGLNPAWSLFYKKLLQASSFEAYGLPLFFFTNIIII